MVRTVPFVCFFFFQAEDGIRDIGVTGVSDVCSSDLGGLRGSAQLLERELGQPELREYTQVIIKEADRLQALMDRMLTPHRAPRIEPLSIHEVLERVRSLVKAEFGIVVERDYDPSLPQLVGD